MEKSTPINWKAFKEVLTQAPDAGLQFQYSGNKRINNSFHITEIKQCPITSVDCGGVMNKWTEIVVQLWEPDGVMQDEPMKVKKALSIIAVVEKTMPLAPEAIVKIEFGNSVFDSRQMNPGKMKVGGKSLMIDLTPDTVQCKANDRGGSCGTTDVNDKCCTATAVKPKTELKNLSVTACCEPACCS